MEKDGGGALRGLVEDGQGEGVPQQTTRLAALAGSPEILGQRDARRRRAEAHGQAQPNRVPEDPPGHAQAQKAGQKVKGRGQGRAVEGGVAALVHVVDVQVLLDEKQVLGPRPPDEIEGGGVGGHHQVGAVVHVLAGEDVPEGGGAAAQHAPALQQRHRMPALLEGDRRGQAREAAPRDHDPHRPQ